MLQLKILKSTWLKQSKAQGNTLPDTKRALVAAGAILPVSSFVLDGDHYKISLGLDAQGKQVALKGLNTWYVFLPHVQLLENGSVIASPTEVTKGDRPINAKGLQILKAFEGCELTAYLCPSSIWTIGYGTTSGVYAGMTISRRQAEEFLKADLNRFERSVSDAVTAAITDDEFSALVCFTYNVGEGAFDGSTLLRLVNQGDRQGAADQFGRWVNGDGGRFLSGLARRRKAERALFLGEDYSQFL